MRSRPVTATIVDELQLATLVAEPPVGDEWLHEQKFDGYRILADKRGDTVQLLSRRFKAWTDEFAAIAEAVRALPFKRIVLDGEVAALLDDGRTSFSAMHDGTRLLYFVFDVLEIDGEALATLPLEERKRRLQAIVPARGLLRYSDHVIGNGAKFFALACEKGLEGIISKRRDRPYAPGRNRDWLKTKCIQRQELVIGGFTEPSGSRQGIGALLVGYYEGKELRYAGKVGTGFTAKTLADLSERVATLEHPASPFSPVPARALTGPRVHWVKPALVAEIAFLEWTPDQRLRPPSFQGLRFDKRARDVTKTA